MGNGSKFSRMSVTLVTGGVLEALNIGNTYQADHAQAIGNIAESALDQIYARIKEENQFTVKKLENSSTDHLPIKITVSKQISDEMHLKTITKRSYKNFTTEKWNKMCN